MGTKKRNVPCDIDTLPEKLKLPISYVKKVIREKNSQKEGEIVPQDEAVDEIVVRCQDENNNDFQLYLRAGMTGAVNKCLKKRGLEILNSQFTINISLTEVASRNVAGSNDNVQNDAGEPFLGHLTGSCTGSTANNDAEKGANANLQTNDNNICLSNVHNVNIHVNALHLAILTRQRGSVEFILKYICCEIEKVPSNCDQFLKVLGERVKIENVADINPELTNVFKFLINMNLFHLSCYYYPEAIRILHKLCCSTDRTGDEHVLGHLIGMKMTEQHNDDRFKCTPLHIAAKKSNVNTARYVIV